MVAFLFVSRTAFTNVSIWNSWYIFIAQKQKQNVEFIWKNSALHKLHDF